MKDHGEFEIDDGTVILLKKNSQVCSHKLTFYSDGNNFCENDGVSNHFCLVHAYSPYSIFSRDGNVSSLFGKVFWNMSSPEVPIKWLAWLCTVWWGKKVLNARVQGKRFYLVNILYINLYSDVGQKINVHPT